MKLTDAFRRATGILLLSSTALLCGGASAIFGVCGPFTDVAADVFCPFVLEVFYIGITTGTTPTTYDPTSAVSRLQMAAFLSRTVDGVLKRGSRRAALNRFATPQATLLMNLGAVGVGTSPQLVASDGADIWVANQVAGTLSRVRASDGKLLDTWTGAVGAFGVLSLEGRIFASGQTAPGTLYALDPGLPPGIVTSVATNLGNGPNGIAFDGNRIWTANVIGSVSFVTPVPGLPWTATTVTAGFLSPTGALFDGASIWVTDYTASKLFRLSGSGAITLTVTVGDGPAHPTFDGANIWVPDRVASSVSVVRASTGVVLATLTGNGLAFPVAAAFDGERILIANELGDSVSLWKAADLTSIGSISTGSTTNPKGACSDGANFWVTLGTTNQLVRF